MDAIVSRWCGVPAGGIFAAVDEFCMPKMLKPAEIIPHLRANRTGRLEVRVNDQSYVSGNEWRYVPRDQVWHRMIDEWISCGSDDYWINISLATVYGLGNVIHNLDEIRISVTYWKTEQNYNFAYDNYNFAYDNGRWTMRGYQPSIDANIEIYDIGA